jgi:hypothetical protein
VDHEQFLGAVEGVAGEFALGAGTGGASTPEDRYPSGYTLLDIGPPLPGHA